MSSHLSQLLADLVDAWNSHDVDRAASFYAPEYVGVDVAQAGPERGQEGIRQMLGRYTAAFPDLRFRADTTVIDGNHVALFWTARGTHLGTLMRIPPSGKAIAVRGVSLLTVERGRITEALYIWDVAGLLRSIGLLPEL